MENLMMANRCYTINFGTKKGDSIRRPKISRLGVGIKTPKSPIEYQAVTEQEWRMVVDRYTYSAIMVEDIAELQAHTNLRQEYTKELGVALARDLDYSVLAERQAIIAYGQGATNTTTTNSHIVTPNTISENEILAAIEVLDRRRVPQEGRVFIMPVAAKSSLLTINRFINRDFINGTPTSTGVVGELYGVPVILNNNMLVNSTAGFFNGDNAVGSPSPGVAGSMYYPTQEDIPGTYGLPVNYYTSILMHPEAIGMAVQKRPSAQAEWDLDYQAWKVASTQVYDLKLYRPDHAVCISSDEDSLV
jgi:Phage capsid protein